MAECPMVLGFTCVFVSSWLFASVVGFNLDTTIPVIKQGPGDSYFGYSVAQHQQLRTDTNAVVSNYLLIGAPNLDIPSSKENNTGGIFKCNALSPDMDDCELLLSAEYAPTAQGDKGRNNQWLGVSVRSGGPGKAVVGCAHRYKITDNNFGLGMCYHLTQDLTFNPDMGQGARLIPCQGYSTRNEHKDYAFCQSGTSSFVNEDERCAIGSPGAIQWRGMISEINISPEWGIKRMFRSMTTDSDPLPPPIDYYSYLGYAVVSGKFDSTDLVYYVASAPRSKEEGQVIFFTEMRRESLLETKDNQKLTGEKAFSGFGHDLLAVDINNDGFDDLIVGCPYYRSEEKDNIRAGGAIYIYSGNGDVITSLTKPQVRKGRSMSQEECDRLDCLHARFGFSLAKTGDLNMDKYQDFAVGAPFEGQGTVYIFHGSEDGVKEQYAQRIYAEDVASATGWESFGYSLSGGMDLDQNTYPDLLVGSYTDSRVALLRTRPIIVLHSNITVTPDYLDMSSDDQKKCEMDGIMYYCVEVKLCLRYTAEPVERFRDPIDIIYEIVAEPGRIKSRMEFRRQGKSSSSVEETFTLLNQEKTGLPGDTGKPRYSCTTEISYLKDSITDVLSTMSFGITYRLPEKTVPIPARTPGALPDINEYPILDAGSVDATFKAEVNFKKPCGDDQICKSNLQMDVNVDLASNAEGIAELDLGREDNLEVNVSLENLGEIAYQATFYMINPVGLKYSQSIPKVCDRYNATMIECNDFGSNELGKPFKSGAKTQFTILFEISDDKLAQVRKISLEAWVNTTSQEITPMGDRVRIPIVVYIKADLEVTGKSSPDSAVTYSGEIRGESAMRAEYMIGPAINHTYHILNEGPGVVNSSEITIYWPYELSSSYPHGKHLLYLMQSPQVLDGGDAFCFDQPEIINVAGIQWCASGGVTSVKDWDKGGHIQPSGSGKMSHTFQLLHEKTNTSNPAYTVIDANGKKRKRRQTQQEPSEINSNDNEPSIGESREKRNVVTLDCRKKNVKCHEIRCRIGYLGKHKGVKISIRARLWESTLLEDFRNVDEVRISSMAKLHIRKELNVVQSETSNDEAIATTIAIPSLQIVAEKPLEWWIIALAVLGGILVLILLALCLWKCGFFKRTRYDDPNTYNVKFEKKRDIDNPTYATKVETQKDYEERDYFLKH